MKLARMPARALLSGAGRRVGTLAAATTAAAAVGLLLLSADALPPTGGTIDLHTTAAGVTIQGRDAGDQAGVFMATGDINGDLVADLIVGALGGDGPGTGSSCGPPAAGDRCQAGEVNVFYGAAGWPATIDLSVDAADLTVYGRSPGDSAGRAVAAGDVNDDGVDDVIIGSVWADPGGRANAGEAYVIYGGPGLPAAIDLSVTAAGVTVRGADVGDYLGYSVASGDVDDDGIDDLIVGARLADGPGAGTSCGTGQVGDRCDAGDAYVFYGGPGLPAIIDLASASADLTVHGGYAGGSASRALTAGDLSGDGAADLVIGAPFASPSGRTEAGVTYAVFGGGALPATIDLASASADLTVLGADAFDFSGWSAVVGDVNDDGAGDLLMSALTADPPGGAQAGEAYAVFGGAGLPAVIDLAATPADITVLGAAADDRLGFAVGRGDVDGDTVADLLIGAIWAAPGGRDQAGETYVLYGSGTPPAVIDLDTAAAGLTVLGDGARDWSGWSLEADDLNDDGTADLVVGAYGADAGTRVSAGEAYIIFGGPREPPPTKQPEPGDTDGDGCSDQRENGPDAMLGGLRDYQDPWDFYDVAGAPPPIGDGSRDGIVDLANDILGVMLHYAPTGAPPYDPGFDRGPANGPYPWNMSGPDGVIDLANDILGVIQQYLHDCR